jgi:hypothetical protein
MCLPVRFILMIMIICFMVSDIYAQDSERRSASSADSVVTRNFAQTQFERNINTFVWDGRAIYENTWNDWFLKINERYYSTLIRTDRKFIKDEQNLSWSVGKRISIPLGIKLQASSIIFSDDRAIGINTASTHSLLGGVEYIPFDFFHVSPLVGIKFDNQSGERDKGFSYFLGSQLRDFDLGGYRTMVSAEASGDDLQPRRNENKLVSLNLDKVFFGRTGFNLQFQFKRGRRDFYYAADSITAASYDVTNNIESREEQIVALGTELHYGIGDLLTTLNTAVSDRTIDKNIRYKNIYTAFASTFDTDIREFRLETYFQVDYNDNRNLKAMARFGYNERDEGHDIQPIEGVDQSVFNRRVKFEKQKDNNAKRTYITGGLDYNLSHSDEMHFIGSSNMLRYDTPSEDNLDDRDELLMFLSLSEVHRFSPYLTLRISADASLNHLVYIFSERSANNNWNRVLRLAPQVDYKPTKNFQTRNLFEVLANYTVYDFEEQVASVRSFSFRQFAFVDSTTWNFDRDIGADLFSQVRLYERGELNWEEFKERPLQYFEEITLAVRLRYARETKMLFAPGWRYFRQTRYAFSQGERNFDYAQSSYGPTCDVEFRLSERSTVVFGGWYEILKQQDTVVREIANVNINVIWNL